jgi:hypothetical protein
VHLRKQKENGKRMFNFFSFSLSLSLFSFSTETEAQAEAEPQRKLHMKIKYSAWKFEHIFTHIYEYEFFLFHRNVMLNILILIYTFFLLQNSGNVLLITDRQYTTE